jgi:putative Holliday junction resolvase
MGGPTLSPVRILAIDPGERRTGLAATDFLGNIAFPLPKLVHRGFEELPALLEPLLEERQAEVLVVGIPLNTQGQMGPQALKVQALVEILKKRFPKLRIETIDEAMTTDIAHAKLKAAGLKASQRKKLADSLAALEILERWRN